MPSVTNDTPTTFTCVDTSGMRHDPKITESAGVVMGRPDNGYFTTRRPEVAQELQQRYPHMLITKHETMHNGRATRPTMRVSLSMKEIEERYQRWLKHQEALQGAVVPQEESANEREQPTK